MSSKHPNLAQNIRPLEYIGGGGTAVSSVPPSNKGSDRTKGFTSWRILVS
jgi:hypothetical protein